MEITFFRENEKKKTGLRQASRGLQVHHDAGALVPGAGERAALIADLGCGD